MQDEACRVAGGNSRVVGEAVGYRIAGRDMIETADLRLATLLVTRIGKYGYLLCIAHGSGRVEI